MECWRQMDLILKLNRVWIFLIKVEKANLNNLEVTVAKRV